MTDNSHILAVAAVAQAAPREWKTLLDSLEVRARSAAEECVLAQPERVFIAQGHARERMAQLNLFRTAVETARRINR